MKKSLPTRPNLDHLRRQAKTLLSKLNDGDATAVRTFIKHLPEAAKMTPAKARAAGFRLADAQSVIARKTGFASWPSLFRHVQHLRMLEGEWHFETLEVDGAALPSTAFASSRMLIDGDRFRMESPEADYEGIFTIDVDGDPGRIDIEFVEGPEAGNWSYGLYELNGDQLTFCLGLTGSSRSAGFFTKPGSGHALERLRRASSMRPAGVTGGTPAPAAVTRAEDELATTFDPAAFEAEMTPLMRRLEGEWAAVELVRGGEPMSADWLSYGSRTTVGNEVKVVFGGQVMVHANMRIDESARPMQVDYLNLRGSQKGRVGLGIMDWVGDNVRFHMAPPGEAATNPVHLREGQRRHAQPMAAEMTGRRRGTTAARERLAAAGAEGLRQVDITTDPENHPSRRVIIFLRA